MVIQQSGVALAGLLLAETAGAGVTSAWFPAKSGGARFPGLIPWPAAIRHLPYPAFSLRHGVAVNTSHAGPKALDLAGYLIEKTRQGMGLHLVATGSNVHRRSIILRMTNEPIHSGPPWRQTEAYRLEVLRSGKAISITASHVHGLFNGIVTLLQLARSKPGGGWDVPAVHIEDYPRLQWRGYMLDVSGMFFDADEVKQLLDAMAALKLNIFHWHLTDNLGWRLPIAKYPHLTSIGAWRPTIGFGFKRSASRHFNAMKQYGGFYTRADIRDVLAYAAQRHITVVPEIEMPGHCMAAARAYPWIACGNNRDSTPRGYPTMDPSNPQVYDFIADVLGETAEMFPGPYIHTGGDEADYSNWQKSPACLALIRQKHLPVGSGKYFWRERYVRPGKIDMKIMEALQGYFEDRVSQIVRSLGRRMISWHDSPHLSPPGMVAMDWHSISPRPVATAMAESRHQVIRCPATYLYFNYSLHWTPTRKVYSFNPSQPGFTSAERPWLLGAQANLWTGHTPNLGALWQSTFPRLCAAAEVFWTPQSQRNWREFQRRLAGFGLPSHHGP
jgi:hexosaminidase